MANVGSNWMAGMTLQTLKKTPALVPLLGSVALGVAICAAYIGRSATSNPDACWDKKNNPYPWQKTKPNTQLKFYSVNIDYKNLAHPKERPDI